MQVILATRNKTKVGQIRGVFEDSGIEIVTMEEVGIEGDPVEDADTLFGNALKKVKFVREHSLAPVAPWVIADDTGLFIRALGGEPGVRSARWAGEHATTRYIMAYTLAVLSEKTDRFATFKTAVVVLAPSGSAHFFEGSVDGEILRSPQAPFQPKMPYSGIFLPAGRSKVLAEMSVEEENQISHRGIAFRKALDFLERCNKLGLI